MSLDLEFDDAGKAIADAIAQFCRDRCADEVVKAAAHEFPFKLWRDLADLGVLALATPEGDGRALELCAAVEALGAALFPGPLVASFFATQVLPPAERARVARGEAIVSLGEPPLMPFAPAASLFIEVRGDRAFLAEPRGPVEPVQTLGGEPWGRVDLACGADLGDTARAHALSDVARAAYLAAAARRLVDDASHHARTRRQFGRSIGEFQAVAHPLADCAIGLSAASTLARVAAFRFDAGDAEARAVAAAARLSACAASLASVYTCHQVFGAVGITLEGPAFHVSRRIRQLASPPPSEETARDAVLARYGL
ncbi:MAG: acyl-CoA dehydrogenase family protein [Deltaproteobacteria bacterium]|nr:MAG: acyl-CoA dehydrogenase family protein [Deltaproteobacteria bacterium]